MPCVRGSSSRSLSPFMLASSAFRGVHGIRKNYVTQNLDSENDDYSAFTLGT